MTTSGPAGAPGVLLLHPWWGVTPAVHWWADQLAAAGRRVLVPDLFDGATAATEEAGTLAQAALADPTTAELVASCADTLAAEGVPWAAMGFSLGAFLACPLAGRGAAAPDELVLLYGGRPPAGSDVRTRRVELHVAPDDPWFTDEELDEVSSGFRDAGAEVVVHRYEGARRWFAEEGSPGHDPAATALARDRVVARLGGTAR